MKTWNNTKYANICMDHGTHRNIVLCNRCKGMGTLLIRTSGYDSEYVECANCDGMGRLREIITVKYEKLNVTK